MSLSVGGGAASLHHSRLREVEDSAVFSWSFLSSTSVPKSETSGGAGELTGRGVQGLSPLCSSPGPQSVVWPPRSDVNVHI